MPDLPGPAWPGQDLALRALSEWPKLQAWALLGRATDPDLAGSAMTLLAMARAEPRRGGLGAMGEAFTGAAASASFRLGLEASEVAVESGRLGNRVVGLSLADGSRVEADAVISTLDIKRSTLALFPWAILLPAMTVQAAHFRMGGGKGMALSGCKVAVLRPPASYTAILIRPGRTSGAAGSPA